MSVIDKQFQTIRPLELDRIGLRKPPAAEQVPEEVYTDPRQLKMANEILGLFPKPGDLSAKVSDSVASDIHEQPVTKSVEDFPEEIRTQISHINPETREIIFKDPNSAPMKVPAQLTVNPDGTLTPSPVTAAASNVKPAAAPQKANSGFAELHSLNAPKPLTPEQIKQKAQELAYQAAAAARARTEAQEAAKAKASMDEVAKNKKDRTVNTEKTTTNHTQTESPNKLGNTLAEEILEKQKGMDAAIENAKDSQRAVTNKLREENTAVTEGAQRGGVAAIKTEGADADAHQQGQKDRGEAEFVQQTDREATVEVGAKRGAYKAPQGKK